ncbi:MAG: hypothetical protein IPM64_17275 [Phycisphaerales bacterium]|nr:hypothetical protein [Phycisphaerales bacterium]
MVESIAEEGRRATQVNMSPRRLETALLRITSGRVVNNAVRASGSDVGVTGEVLECAFARQLGLRGIERDYSPAVLDASARRYRRGISLTELIQVVAAPHMRGQCSIRSNYHDTLEAAFTPARGDFLASAPSTIDLPGILSNVANKMLREYFLGLETAWRDVAAIESVSDFKETSTYSMTGDFSFRRLEPGGQIEHAQISEVGYGNKADTYARFTVLDRRDIINDSMGALTGVMRRLANGAAQGFNTAFWTEFNSARASFFTEPRGNRLAAGAGTAFSIKSLEALEALVRKQTGPDGAPLGLLPRVLLVPADLAVKAAVATGSIETRTLPEASSGTSAEKIVGTTNYFYGKYRVVSSAYLGSAALGGNATAFFLLTDPAQLPLISAVFYNGQQVPTVESARLDYDRAGISMRGLFDFGVRLQEYRAGAMSPGA